MRAKRARDDSVDEYSWFFRDEYERVLRTAYLIVGDQETARDLTQEAFARLYRHWKKVCRYDRPDAWVRQVVVRLAVQNVRRKKIWPADPTKAPVQLEIDAVRWDLQAAIRSLSPMQRAAVLLFYFEDRPSSEIGQILGCSESTVRVHLHRARKTLAAHFVDREHENAV